MNRYQRRYIGLMSGTSIDGVDVALVEFSDQSCKLLSIYNHAIDSSLKQELISLSSPIKNASQQNRIETLGKLDVQMGETFADAVNQLIKINQIDKKTITAIGNHGQTIRHRPNNPSPFTLQIGDANIIAQRTGIATVSDFRRMDIAAGGQGAPLAPAFHNAILRSTSEDRIILNLGGIANITSLPKNIKQPVIGFDTGPANTLMDAWYKRYHPQRSDDFDRNSQFAQQGQISPSLLAQLLSDPYFKQNYPKSTGREYFSIDWLDQQLEKQQSIPSEDVQRTLVEFTSQTIAQAILSLSLKGHQILACGGGMHNKFLLTQLSRALNRTIITTNDAGVDGDYLEAMTFAWLAKQRINQEPGNLPSVTGASSAKILGALYLP